jgi:hypothetical protein
MTHRQCFLADACEARADAAPHPCNRVLLWFRMTQTWPLMSADLTRCVTFHPAQALNAPFRAGAGLALGASRSSAKL